MSPENSKGLEKPNQQQVTPEQIKNSSKEARKELRISLLEQEDIKLKDKQKSKGEQKNSQVNENKEDWSLFYEFIKWKWYKEFVLERNDDSIVTYWTTRTAEKWKKKINFIDFAILLKDPEWISQIIHVENHDNSVINIEYKTESWIHVYKKIWLRWMNFLIDWDTRVFKD